jgi:hypothetical protein
MLPEQKFISTSDMDIYGMKMFALQTFTIQAYFQEHISSANGKHEVEKNSE